MFGMDLMFCHVRFSKHIRNGWNLVNWIFKFFSRQMSTCWYGLKCFSIIKMVCINWINNARSSTKITKIHTDTSLQALGFITSSEWFGQQFIRFENESSNVAIADADDDDDNNYIKYPKTSGINTRHTRCEQ